MDLLPYLQSAFGIYTNFNQVFNRAKFSLLSARISTDEQFRLLTQARAGDQQARSRLCSYFVSGDALLLDQMNDSINLGNRLSVRTIDEPVSPLEGETVRQAELLREILRRNIDLASLEDAVERPVGRIYGINKPVVAPLLPPRPLIPVNNNSRRRLQGVGNVSPGFLGRNIVNITEYSDDYQRIVRILSPVAIRPAITPTSIIDPPTPVFKVGDRVIGNSPRLDFNGPLTIIPERDLRSFVQSKPNGSVRFYQVPVGENFLSLQTLNNNPFLRYLAPLSLRIFSGF